MIPFLFSLLTSSGFAQIGHGGQPLPVNASAYTRTLQPLQIPFVETYASDIVNAVRLTIPLAVDALVQKPCLVEYYPRAYINGPSLKTCEMGIKLINDHVDKIICSIEKYTPQAPDIRYLDLPYKPYDSRTDEVTL